MLEEHGKIDMIATAPDGMIELVICDMGQTKDHEERNTHFREKLKTYVAYICSDEFKTRFPGKMISDIRICLMCMDAPTQMMSDNMRVCPRGMPSASIEVVVRRLPRFVLEAILGASSNLL